MLSNKLPRTSSSLNGGQLLPLPGRPSWNNFLDVVQSHPEDFRQVAAGTGVRWRVGGIALETGQQVKATLAVVHHAASQQEHPPRDHLSALQFWWNI